MQTANKFLERSKNIICQKIFRNKKLIKNCHFSYGFPSNGAFSKRRVKGQAWEQKKIEAIFISPTLFRKGNLIDVLSTLIHEIIHIKIGIKHGHKKLFKQEMRKIGLEGKAKSTQAGKELTGRLNDLKFPLLPILHLNKSMIKKQSTRMIKLICSCKRIIRVSQSTISEGGITCDICKKQFI